MRLIVSFIRTVLIVAIAVGLVAFSIENAGPVQIQMFGFAFPSTLLWVPTVVGVAIGLLLAFLLLTLGRVYSWQNRQTRQMVSQYEAEISALRQRITALEQEVERLSSTPEPQPVAPQSALDGQPQVPAQAS